MWFPHQTKKTANSLEMFGSDMLVIPSGLKGFTTGPAQSFGAKINWSLDEVNFTTGRSLLGWLQKASLQAVTDKIQFLLFQNT